MRQKTGKINILRLCLMFACLTAIQMVSAQSFKNGEKFHLGVEMGMNSTRLMGTELESPRDKLGMTIGAHFRKKLSDNLQIAAELSFSLRGSNFDFIQENEYYAMKFTYMDLPLNLMINTSGASQDQFLVLGFEPAYLMQSEIYVKPDFRASYRNEFFKRVDVAAMAGYRFDFYYFGIQPSVKVGLRNINDKMNLVGVTPATGKNGTIKNLTFDLKVYF